MTRAEMARLLDHSVLKPEASESEILAGAALVRTLAIGYYCVQPCWVGVAASALKGTDARIVAVVGFPHGCDEPAVKAQAAVIAVSQGTREIDMVMNLGLLKSGAAAAKRARSPKRRGASHAASRSIPALPSSRPRPDSIPPAAPPWKMYSNNVSELR